MRGVEELLSVRARSTGSSVIRDLLHLLEQPGILSLAGGLPAAETMRVDRVSEALAWALSVAGRYGPVALQYGPTEGARELRDLVAAQYQADDGRTTSNEVVVTTGSQQGLDLLARALLDPGDTVAIEVPSYLGALQTFATHSPRVEAIPLDRDGMCTDVFEARLRSGSRPKLCYVVPNFQNPSGATLSSERRVHLAALADRYGFVVIEDDPYGRLRFRGNELLPIRVHSELVVTLGSASKIISPGLRVGWMAAPLALHGAVVRAKQASDLHTSGLNQLAVYDVLRDEPFLAQHCAALRSLYATRCDALADALRGSCQFERPDGGLFLWAQFAGVDTATALQRATQAGVAYVPGGAFGIDTAWSEHARLSFAALTPAELATAAARLRSSLAGASGANQVDTFGSITK